MNMTAITTGGEADCFFVVTQNKKKAPYWSLGQGLGDFSSFLKFSLGEAAAQ